MKYLAPQNTLDKIESRIIEIGNKLSVSVFTLNKAFKGRFNINELI